VQLGSSRKGADDIDRWITADAQARAGILAMMPRRIAVLAASGLIAVAALGYGLGDGLAPAADRPAGYGTRVDFARTLGPPPIPGSPQDAADRAELAGTIAGIGGQRWQQAAAQVFPTSREVTAEISCALGRRISPATTPLTARLLADVAADLRGPVEAAKAFYKRDRPYVGTPDTRTCDPRSLGRLGGRNGGVLTYAYPSGHAAYGRLWARTLAAAVPARTAPLSAWGTRLGDNRIVCRVHWPSDVAAGRRLADAVYLRLAADADFRADLAAARVELARSPVPRDCG